MHIYVCKLQLLHYVLVKENRLQSHFPQLSADSYAFGPCEGNT